jgi:alkaline phosphatase D
MSQRNHRRFGLAALAAVLLLQSSIAISCARSEVTSPLVHLAMGFRVGEVTQDSAVIWSRITAYPQRNWDGIEVTGRPGERTAEFTPLEVPTKDLQGAVPGAAGELRLLISTDRELSRPRLIEWTPVSRDSDFAHNFRVEGLNSATRYYLRIEARSGEGLEISRTPIGSFVTAAGKEQWQDVCFTVVTGQMYQDLDHAEGFNIYLAMAKLSPQFLVLTGDTVYYDNELPRARTTELARYHWQRMYSLPRIRDFHLNVPGYWEKDDHDTLSDDVWPTQEVEWMSPMEFWEGVRIFKEQVPFGEAYRSVRWGKGLHVWLVEGRDFRSANDESDGPDKTIWGFEQREWLMRTIQESDADFKVLISPTPIVGPDRPTKADNHSNQSFAFEGQLFRDWTANQGLSNFYVVCGDRHWQYMSVDPKTGLREFSCGPASDQHAGGTPGFDPGYHRFHSVQGGFLSATTTLVDEVPTISFRFHAVDGEVVYEFSDSPP